MNTPLQNRLRTQIASTFEFEFQRFICDLFLRKYGELNFQPLREVKDGGADGIILPEATVLACYAPKKNTQKAFVKKINGDFESYQKNWESKYSSWVVVINHAPSPDQIKYVDTLKKGSSIIGLESIISIFQKLPSSHQRRLGETLRIETEYFARDFIQEIVGDLLRSENTFEASIVYKIPIIDPMKKLKINFDASALEAAEREYENLEETFPLISGIIHAYEDFEISQLKQRIIRDFYSTQGPFKESLDAISSIYLARYSNGIDDTAAYYIRALLMYMFGQCLIGKKIEGEK